MASAFKSPKNANEPENAEKPKSRLASEIGMVKSAANYLLSHEQKVPLNGSAYALRIKTKNDWETGIVITTANPADLKFPRKTDGFGALFVIFENGAPKSSRAIAAAIGFFHPYYVQAEVGSIFEISNSLKKGGEPPFFSLNISPQEKNYTSWVMEPVDWGAENKEEKLSDAKMAGRHFYLIEAPATPAKGGKRTPMAPPDDY